MEFEELEFGGLVKRKMFHRHRRAGGLPPPQGLVNFRKALNGTVLRFAVHHDPLV